MHLVNLKCATNPADALRQLQSKPNNGNEKMFYYHILKPGQIILQPSLIAHSVITLPVQDSIGLISFREAANL